MAKTPPSALKAPKPKRWLSSLTRTSPRPSRAARAGSSWSGVGLCLGHSVSMSQSSGMPSGSTTNRCSRPKARPGPTRGFSANQEGTMRGHSMVHGRPRQDRLSWPKRREAMKVNVEVSCTPEEARAFFGLPDIKPMQDRIMGEIEERLRSSLGAMNPETVFKTWLPASMQGMEQMQQMQQAFWSQLANIANGKKE